jgi:Fe-S cluster assembly protein SufD
MIEFLDNHQAWLHQNIFTVPKHSILATPIHIILSDNSDYTFNVEPNSEVTIIIEFKASRKDLETIQLVLNVKQNSHVKYVFISEEKAFKTLINQTINVDKDANLKVISGFLSQHLEANVKINLNGENARAMINAIVVSNDHQQQTVDVHMTHFAPHSYGDMYNVGISNGYGRVTLNGIEKIEKGMKQANAFQTLKGIILSDFSMVDVNPILLIDEYDVKAGHGATVGKIEEQQLYYLQSRGLSKIEAEKLIIKGYIKPILDAINDSVLVERLEKTIYERI